MIEKYIDFLKNIDKDFHIPLSEKVNLDEFGLKLFSKANVFTEVVNGKIIGMVAGYIDNCENNISYISIVGVRKEYRGNKIAEKLLIRYIEECKNKNIKLIHLYTNINNYNAIRLYKKLGFEKYVISNERRPHDCHLALNLE